MSSEALEAYRHTLERLVEERRSTATELKRIETAIETIVRFLPDDEHHTYLNCLSDRGEGSRFTPETTLAEAGEMVLRHIGEPMRIGAIVKMLREWRYPYAKDDPAMQASLGAILARKATRGETFSRPETGTFGLMEWDEASQIEAPAPQRAPATAVTPIGMVRTGTDGGKRLIVRRPPSGTNTYDDFRAPEMDDDDNLPF